MAKKKSLAGTKSKLKKMYATTKKIGGKIYEAGKRGAQSYVEYTKPENEMKRLDTKIKLEEKRAILAKKKAKLSKLREAVGTGMDFGFNLGAGSKKGKKKGKNLFY